MRQPSRGRGEQAARRCSLGHPGFAAGAGQGAPASKKLTLREKDRIEAARITAGTLEPEPPAADGLSEVASFLERFEAEQKARTKAHNDRTALRRKALTQGKRPA